MELKRKETIGWIDLLRVIAKLRTSVRHDDRSFAFSPPQQHERVLPETHRAHCATPHFLVGHATGAVLRIPELYCHH